MAYSRLLLLMIGVIASPLPQVKARPSDFWCNRQARKNMERRIEGLQTDMLQQKHAEVSETLQMFQDGMQRAMSQATLQCQTSLLEKVEHQIRNYLAIVSSLQLESDAVNVSPSSVQSCFNETSLNKVLEQYRTLVGRKLEHLTADLQDSICKVEDGPTNLGII